MNNYELTWLEPPHRPQPIMTLKMIRHFYDCSPRTRRSSERSNLHALREKRRSETVTTGSVKQVGKDLNFPARTRICAPKSTNGLTTKISNANWTPYGQLSSQSKMTKMTMRPVSMGQWSMAQS